MKQNTKTLLTLGLAFSLFTVGSAVSLKSSEESPFSNQLTQDIDTHGTAYFAEVTTPGETDETVGDSVLSLTGSGSVLVMSTGYQGYPRTLVIGGTTVKSNRSVSEVDEKPWWNGAITAPKRIPKPNRVTIAGVNDSNVEIIDAFAVGTADGSEVGLRSEFLTFSPAATLAFKTDESEGQKLWVAHRGVEGYKATANDYCIVDSDGDCFYSFSGGNYIALAKGSYTECSVESVPNGSVSAAPSCAINCHSGYEIDMTGSQCVEKDYTYTTAEKNTAEAASEAVGSFVEDMAEDEMVYATAPADNYQAMNTMEAPVEDLQTVRDGYFRYRRDPERGTVDLDAIDDADTRRIVSKLNAGIEYSQRPSASAEKLSASNTSTGSRDDGRLSYMIQMRNYFGSASQPNVFGGGTQVAAQENMVAANTKPELMETDNSNTSSSSSNDMKDSDDEEMDGLHSVGPLLPSTGPSWFLIIALLGIAMMVFASRQRN